MEGLRALLKLVNVTKTFYSDGKEFDAVKNVSLEIKKGEIFGIIGLSGAGKSTLVRCINYLETPTSGSVIFEGVNLGGKGQAVIRQARRSMGMIFQQFNLLSQRNVLRTCASPWSFPARRRRKR